MQAAPSPPTGGAAARKSKSSAAAGNSSGEGVRLPALGGAAPKMSLQPSPPPAPINGRELWVATDALHKEKAQRQFFQLERDRLLSFWEVTKRDLEDAKDKCREKESQKKDEAERQAMEIEVLKQQVRHVLYEHEVQVSKSKLEAEHALHAKLDEYKQDEESLRQESHDTKGLQRQREIENRDLDVRLREEHDQAISEQQQQFEREIREIHLKYKRKLKMVREEMEDKRRDELASIAQRKEEHVAELREMHDRAFREIKEYYNEITTNNLETIRMLKDEVYSRKKTESHNEKAMLNVANKNRKLTEPLRKLQKQREDLEAQLENYASTKTALREVKASVKTAEQRIQTIDWEHEVLSQRYAKLVEDRDIIFAKYNTMLQEVQSKAMFRRVLVSKKIDMVKDALEKREQGLHEVLRHANVDPDAIQGIEQRVRDYSSEKDQIIANLQSQVETVTHNHEAAVAEYEQYLRENALRGLKSSH